MFFGRKPRSLIESQIEEQRRHMERLRNARERMSDEEALRYVYEMNRREAEAARCSEIDR